MASRKPLKKKDRSGVSTEKHETTAGNYFVSNYPPFSFWTADQVPAFRASLEKLPAEGVPLGLYIHIPFCRKRCHFCYFKVYTDRNAAAIQHYIDAVVREIWMYSERAFMGGRQPQFVYFGGGTPSYLSARQLTHLTDGLKSALPWNGVEEVTFECEPGTLNESKLKAVHDFGVTRLSLGIENFNDRILEVNGRAHLSKEVYAAYDWARRTGFEQINVDLIAGMLEETEENWAENVRETIALDPDCVTIYQMEIPFNTTIYQRMKAEGKLFAPVADWETKRRWVRYAFQELEKAGYTVTSAYTAVKHPERTRFVYRDSLWRGADMLALGVSSFGHIGGVHYQNEKNIDAYVECLQRGELPISRALPISWEEATVREMILQLKTGRLERGYFRQKFDLDVVERFAQTFKDFEESGLVRIDERQVRLDREGLLNVDSMLREFFLPQHRDARYV